MKSGSLKSRQSGFTIVELLFAMSGFSIMLVIAVSGFLNAVWIYNQANVSRDNQQQVRRVMDQMGGDIRSATSVLALGESTLCLSGTEAGNIVYHLDAVSSMLQSYTPMNGCSPGMAPAPGTTKDMFTTQDVTVFKVKAISQPPYDGAANTSVQVNLKVIRGSESSVRARQFSNSYSLQSTYLVRGNQ